MLGLVALLTIFYVLVTLFLHVFSICALLLFAAHCLLVEFLFYLFVMVSILFFNPTQTMTKNKQYYTL